MRPVAALLILIAGPMACAQRLEELAEQLIVRTDQDLTRITPSYAAPKLAAIDRIITGHIVTTISKGEAIQPALTQLLKPYSWNDPDPIFTAKVELRPAGAMVAAYNWAYGPRGIPWTHFAFHAFTRTAQGFRPRATFKFDEAESGCLATVVGLESPKPQEAWFLVRCHVIGASRWREKLRILSFNGSRFEQRWLRKDAPEIEQVTVEGARIRIEWRGDDRKARQDTITLTGSGVRVSTQ